MNGLGGTAFLLFPPDEGAVRRRYQDDLTGLVELEVICAVSGDKKPAAAGYMGGSGKSSGGFRLALIAAFLLITAPGFHYRLDHRRQRNGEEDAPEAPQTAENQHGDDDGDRMYVHRFGENQRHDDVAVQNLHREIQAGNPVEIAGEAVLHVGDDQHRDGDDGRADVGNQHGEANHEAEQQAVLQVEDVQRDEGQYPDDEDFADFAADVVANLDIDFVPDVLDDFAPFRQEAAKPGHDELFVLEEEKEEQRHEDDVHQRLDDDEDGVKQLAGE